MPLYVMAEAPVVVRYEVLVTSTANGTTVPNGQAKYYTGRSPDRLYLGELDQDGAARPPSAGVDGQAFTVDNGLGWTTTLTNSGTSETWIAFDIPADWEANAVGNVCTFTEA